MNSPAARDTLSDPRETILDAAQNRLLHFGYHKTTMAEIADDVGMSAANLYRYFRNKQEIVAECAARCMDERLERLRIITDATDREAGDKLLAYALELIDDSHALTGEESRVGELVEQITRERPDLIHTRNEVHFALLESIISQGVADGHFDVNDIASCARAVHASLTLFDVPLFVGLYSREEFETRARAVIALLIDGLQTREPPPGPAMESIE